MDHNEEPDLQQVVDFSNTEIAFSNKSNKELKKTAFLFRLMNNPHLVNLSAHLSLWATKVRLPFADHVVESTIFYLFCGGKTLLECQPVIDKLHSSRVLTVMDYGAESKTTREEWDGALNEILKSVKFAASNASVPVVSTKVSALTANALLEKWQSKQALTEAEQDAFTRARERLETLCRTCQELGVRVFVDAEESWMQDTIDHLVEELMEEFNREEVVVYNTYQMYRHDKLQDLHRAYQRARDRGYKLGAKLVRGAYMIKERERAEEMGYPSPIQPDKASTDRDYNKGIAFCVEHYEGIASCNASHNLESNLLQAQMIADKDLPKSHPHLNFCQLYGMSDYITYNLAEAGYNVAKYVVYGPIKEVVPYLVRRAQENSSVTGEMSRELSLIMKEIRRRKI